MEAAVAISMTSIQTAIGVIFDGIRRRDEQFEESFRNLDYERLQHLLISKFKCLMVLYRSTFELLKTDSVTTKSEEQSDLARNYGNEMIRSSSIFNCETTLAVVYSYDLALAYAKTSDRKAKAYGNLSAIYFRMDHMPQTLRAIEYAMNHIDKSDHAFMSKLQLRKLKCQHRLEMESNDSGDAAELSYPSHSTISGLSEVLELKGNKCLSTKKPLKCGDIIAITKSFCFSIEPVFRRQFCNYCGDRTGVKIPCDHCSTTMFCGESCKILAMEGFHGIECDYISDFLVAMDGIKYLALKFAFKAMTIANSADFQGKPNFTCFDWKDADENDEGIIMKTILSMNEATLNFEQIFSLVSHFEILMEKLRTNDRFKAFVNRFDNGEKRLFEMYCKAYLVIRRNCFYIDFVMNIDWLFGNLKQSCKPNIMIIRDSKDGTNHYLVINHIAANGELTIAYG